MRWTEVELGKGGMETPTIASSLAGVWLRRRPWQRPVLENSCTRLWYDLIHTIHEKGGWDLHDELRMTEKNDEA